MHNGQHRFGKLACGCFEANNLGSPKTMEPQARIHVCRKGGRDSCSKLEGFRSNFSFFGHSPRMGRDEESPETVAQFPNWRGGGGRCCNNAQFELGREAEEIHFRQSPPSFHIARGFRGSKVSRGFLRWQKCTLKLLVSPFHPCRISHIRKCKNGETKWQTIRLRALSHAFS